MKHLLHSFILLLGLSVLSFAETTITCEPKQLRGVPGEPLRLSITIETDRALPAKLSIPHFSSLTLRSVEKTPIQRNPEGRYIQKRIVIWQGLEAGSISLTNLTVRLLEQETNVPSVNITIDEVNPASPPNKKEDNE